MVEGICYLSHRLSCCSCQGIVQGTKPVAILTWSRAWEEVTLVGVLPLVGETPKGPLFRCVAQTAPSVGTAVLA